MDQILTAGQPVAAARDAGVAFLPAEQRLEMPDQRFSDTRRTVSRPRGRWDWIPRAALFGGAVLATVAFGAELYDVLAFVQMTPIQLVFLVLSTIAFGWIALGSLSAALGFLPLFAGDPPDTLALPGVQDQLISRTALLFPIYEEDPTRIAGTIEAMAEDLAALGKAPAFDVFVLSDTRSESPSAREEMVFAALAQRLSGTLLVYYRRRHLNIGKKAGNVREWIERFGGRYASFVVLDADSVMSGDTLARLALAIERKPRIGLIQTVPRLVGGRTLFQRLQQFASGVYGPSVAAGLGAWQRAQGNYWGHNAIIRTSAFAEAAGLPTLRGRKPFGGDIRSHDFVEAVLLQRAGYEVHMVPSLGGSFEGAPPGLIELIVRDRRWAQGNIQHLAIVGARGLTPVGRIHLAIGVASYVVSAIWAASLAVGLVLALQSQHLIPSYFQDSRTLFPVWPEIDPGAAFRLFLATMFVVLLPKVLGLVLEIKRARAAGEPGATFNATGGVLIETFFSLLFAPVLMLTQTIAVVTILAGRDVGWKAQRRGGGPTSLSEALRFFVWHMPLGIVIAGLCFIGPTDLMAWMSPVILGLILSALLAWVTSRRTGPLLAKLLSIPEDRDIPPVLRRVDEHAAAWANWLEGRGGPADPAGALPRAA